MAYLYGLVVGFILGVFSMKLWPFEKASKKKENTDADINDCIFFSATNVKCDYINSNCEYRETGNCNCCSYRKVTGALESTQRYLDICVYLITAEEICHIITKLFKEGKFVRIITDKQMSEEASGAKVLIFRKSYVPLKVVQHTQIMHNKFVIIDKKILITGSFNWTRQGFNGNYENGIIMTDSHIVKSYNEYFQKLWDESN